MLQTMRRRVLPITLCMLAAVSWLSRAEAQSAEPPAGEEFASVVFPGVLLEQGIPSGHGLPAGNGERWSDLLGYLAVYADGMLCAHVPIVPGHQGDLVVRLGGDAQPAACSTANSFITLRTGLLPDEDLAARFRLAEGVAHQITTLAPILAETSPPLESESATIVIPADLRNSPIPGRGGPTWTDFAGGAIGVHADGERCTILSL